MKVYLKLIVINLFISSLVFVGGLYYYTTYIEPQKIVTIDVKRLLDLKKQAIKNPMVGVTLYNATKRYIDDKVGNGTIVLAKASVVNDSKFKDITDDVISYSGINALFDNGVIPEERSKKIIMSKKEKKKIEEQAKKGILISDSLLHQVNKINDPNWLP